MKIERDVYTTEAVQTFTFLLLLAETNFSDFSPKLLKFHKSIAKRFYLTFSCEALLLKIPTKFMKSIDR